MVCCFLVLISYLIVVNKQYIVDQITVWQYKPSQEILALVERAGMNDSGKFIYLASEPKLDGTQNFNSECNRVENVTSILGCYSDGKIFIYDVTDSQLDGIREVTASHETLHAVYDRLNIGKREKLNKLLDREYEKLKDDENFSQIIAYYDKAEPGQFHNELHSLIGTKILNINPELESYYKKYFVDRSKVVALDEKYSTVFSLLENKAKELIEKMNTLSDSILNKKEEYNNTSLALSNEINEFNKKANDGDFVSQSDFYYQRSMLTNRVSLLNILRDEINNDIKEYNGLLKEYNSIASQSEKLYNSIDSTLAPAPSI